MLKSVWSVHQAALACSVTLHAGLLAWMTWPDQAAYLPRQRIMDISVVTAASLAPPPSEPLPVVADAAVLPPLPAQAAVPVEPAAAKRAVKKIKPNHERKTAGSPSADERVSVFMERTVDAAYLHNTPPPYPDAARREGMEGKVLLDVDITPQGTAQAVSVRRSSGHELLDRAARAAVRRWRFIPAQRGNERVQASAIVPVEFRLE